MTPHPPKIPPALLFARRLCFVGGAALVVLLVVAVPFVGTPDGEKTLAFMRVNRRLSVPEFYLILGSVYAAALLFLVAAVSQFFIWHFESRSEK